MIGYGVRFGAVWRILPPPPLPPLSQQVRDELDDIIGIGYIPPRDCVTYTPNPRYL